MHDKYFLNGEWILNVEKDSVKYLPKEISKKIKNIKGIVPGTVHTDLLTYKLIEEPFASDNEKKLGWISNCDWIYSKAFSYKQKKSSPVKLVFEGIDTIAQIFLNGEKIGLTDNMFLKYEFDVTPEIRDGQNKIEVRFQSPVKYCIEHENKHGKLPAALESHRVYIRKAQYSFGWDWGPSFPTMGIWCDVYLIEEDKCAITNFTFNTKETCEQSATVQINYSVQKSTDEKITAKISVKNGSTAISKEIDEVRIKNSVEIKIDNPLLWFPNGYGEQNLYELEIVLFDESKNIIDKIERKVGIRTVRLQTEENGKHTFRFIVNGKKIYAKGVNWIPGDAFLPRVSIEKYAKLLQYAKDASMNIVRVWGGGIYESDFFYELCDELGFLVWQDFMFACGAYPEHEEFIENVKKEVDYNARRLQYHPSIALWCGNNENEWIWTQEQKTSYKNMPGYKIYHDIIPTILNSLDSSRPYWQSSPFGFDEDPNSQTSGNRHQWNIWSMWIDYSKVNEDKSLFITEFGFQGPANVSTFEKYLSKDERKIHGEVFEFHNKQIEGPERVARFLSAHLPLTENWEDYIYLAQLNQGFALKTCLDHWRFNQPQTNGSIIWQINDTWPVTSWSLVDSELKPKQSYYFVKKSFAPVSVKFNYDADKIELLGLNQNDFAFKGIADIIILESDSGKDVFRRKINIALNGSSIQTAFAIARNKVREDQIVIATLFDAEGNYVAREFLVFKPWKYLTLPETKIKLNIKKFEVELSVTKPAVFVDLDSPECEFSNRAMIILPGEKVFVKILNAKMTLNKDQIQVRCLNQFINKRR
ncbi:MAG: sugar-binding domain-containing protein [bacterium]